MGTAVRAWRSDLSGCLATVLLVAACGGPTPTPAASSAPSAAPTPMAPAPNASATAPAPTPSATPAAAGLPPGSLAVTVSDRLRVRSQPRVADDSVRYQPLLPTGTELLVIEGPVEASGYDWYRVAPVSLELTGGIADGWVAAADHDGTPWIALAGDPLSGIEFAKASVTRATGTTADARRAAASVNAFAVDLYRRMRTDASLALDRRNVVLSPTSIALALAMTRAGARGQTAAEMDDVLHTVGWRQLAAGLNALDQELAGHDATWTEGRRTHALALRIANAAFGQPGYAIEPAYLDAIAQAFGAGLGLVDYMADPDAARRVINEWVSRQTARRIPELLGPPDVTTATRLVLVNAIYLKANWLVEFDPDSTAERSFTRSDGSPLRVPTMTLWGEQSVPYASGSGWKATDLRYRGADGSTPLTMTLILPNEMAAFEKGLSSSRLASIVAKLDRQRDRLQEVTFGPLPEDCGTYPYSVRLYMPRWGIETRAKLPGVLSALGMPSAFQAGRADFSGITTADPTLHIGTVIHQANIDIDEKGTEAAAATAVGMDTGGCTGPEPAKTVTLRLNRPFLFLLRDVKTGAILFMGRVLDPSVRS